MAETTGIINGTSMAVYVEGVKVAVATGGTISISMPTRETSNKDVSTWVTRLPNRGSWSIGGSSFFRFEDSETNGFNMLMSALVARTAVTVMVSTQLSGNKRYYGEAYCNQLDADFPDDDNSTFTFNFEGTGALTNVDNT